jgi:hypothetical protein
LPDAGRHSGAIGFKHDENDGWRRGVTEECSTVAGLVRRHFESPFGRLILWCKLLISLYFSLPNLSSICHKPQPMRLGGTSAASFAQSYPQILWVTGADTHPVE